MSCRAFHREEGEAKTLATRQPSMELATGVVALLEFLAVEAVNQVTAIEEGPNPVPDEVIDGERVPSPVK
jgi:hypothetical protein